MPYTLEVHHKPVHDTESLRLWGSAHSCTFCSLFGGGDFQGLSKYVLHSLENAVAKIVYLFISAKEITIFCCFFLPKRRNGLPFFIKMKLSGYLAWSLLRNVSNINIY